MSTIKVTNIQDINGNNSQTTEQLYKGTCKAWVNFDGRGTTDTNQTIRQSYNVSSVYKESTGVYTIYFTIQMPDADYVLVGTGGNPGGNTGFIQSDENSYVRTPSSIRIDNVVISGGTTIVNNGIQMNVAIFR